MSGAPLKPGRPGDADLTTAIKQLSLPADTTTVDLAGNGPSRRWVQLGGGPVVTNAKPFAVGDLPEVLDTEPNNAADAAQKIEAAFNFVWQIDRLRPVSQRFSNYLSVITIGPVLVFSAVGITATMMNTQVAQWLVSVEPFGTMMLFDIAFNPATVMIAAVALGIVVDDTVHLMTAFERQRSHGAEAAVRSAVLEVGRPVLVTSVLLAIGFALLMLGSFLPSRQIGGLVATIAVAALVTDLLVLPVVLRGRLATSRSSDSAATA